MPEKRKTKEIERRCFPVSEFRAIEDDKGLRHIIGYAAVFNSFSEEMYGFREKIAPGCFTKTIKEDDVRALWNHDSNHVLGRNKSGTLTLSEDSKGLKIDILPPDAQWARDLMTSIDRGDIDQMSFGFAVKKQLWEGEYPDEIRTLIEVKLYDVSPVTFPAYPDTEVGLRSLEEYRKGKNTPPAGGDHRAEDRCKTTVLLSEEDEAYRKIMCV